MGIHNKKFVGRRCLNSYTSENMLMIHKPKCKNYDIATIRTSSESHVHCKDCFREYPLYFKIYADFEADNEIDNSSVGNKTTNIHKQYPVLNVFHEESELDDMVQSS